MTNIYRSEFSDITITKQLDRLRIEIKKVQASQTIYAGMIPGFFFFAIAFKLLTDLNKVVGEYDFLQILLWLFLLLLFSALGAGVFFLVASFAWYDKNKFTYLQITPQNYVLYFTEYDFFKVRERIVEGSITEINLVKSKTEKVGGGKTKSIWRSCTISLPERDYRFGVEYELKSQDIVLIAQEINAFLEQVRTD